uniref:C1q domain-containing protein n=1 Tax=Schistosoma curassoni TaxID=6186 RepID=A0A183K762_9TREM
RCTITTKWVVLLSWCESTFWATVTNQAIIQLNKNDQIWLECRDEAYRLHGHMYSSLSGYLLYPHDI